MPDAVDTPPPVPPSGVTPPPSDRRPLPSPSTRRPGNVPSINRGTDAGTVDLHPTGLAGVDIAAELTANLTLRMAPPPDPPADLAVTTCAWLLVCLAASVLWVGGVLSEAALLPFVGLLGVLTLAFGYLWAAYLAGRRDWLRGAVTLIPPVAAWRLTRPFGDNGRRPLVFALTGAFVFGLYWVGDEVRAQVQSALDFGRPEPATVAAVPAADRLKSAERQPDGVVQFLIDLATADARKSIPAAEWPALTAEIVRLTRPGGSDRPDVRAQAVRTLAAWSPADARGVVLAGVKSGEGRDRRAALELAPRWPDAEMAAAVAGRLPDPAEEAVARDALTQMPAAAEGVLIGLLTADDPMLALTAAELLGKVGGPAAVTALDGLSRTAADPVVRGEAARQVEAIRTRPAATTAPGAGGSRRSD